MMELEEGCSVKGDDDTASGRREEEEFVPTPPLAPAPAPADTPAPTPAPAPTGAEDRRGEVDEMVEAEGEGVGETATGEGRRAVEDELFVPGAIVEGVVNVADDDEVATDNDADLLPLGERGGGDQVISTWREQETASAILTPSRLKSTT